MIDRSVTINSLGVGTFASHTGLQANSENYRGYNNQKTETDGIE